MLEVQQLKKYYTKLGETVRAIDGISLCLDPGEFAVFHGASGSGKSTLLLILGGMLSPTAGTVCFNGMDIYHLSRLKRNRYRRMSVGFLFQKFYLMPYLTVYDNIRMPLLLRGDNSCAPTRITELAEQLQIAARLKHRPAELSVGEQQRVAMARSLAAEPEIILADEPTGNLDRINRDIIAECLAEESRRGRTIVLATHEETLIKLGTREFHLDAGKLQMDRRNSNRRES